MDKHTLRDAMHAAAVEAICRLWSQTPDLRYWVVGALGLAILSAAVLSF